jgi:hypothetical protein
LTCGSIEIAECGEVTCEFWDREALDESGVQRSKDGKRRLLAPRRPMTIEDKNADVES